MNYVQRQKKVRKLVRQANQKHKKQAKQIDILCNDLLEFQRDFIQKLNKLSFKAAFYETIIGISDLNQLLNTTATLIRHHNPTANVAFALRDDHNFVFHFFENQLPGPIEQQPLADSFTPKLVDSICQANKPCMLDDLLAMGLQVNPALLAKISLAAFPLVQPAHTLGFLLIYQPSDSPATTAELNHLAGITPGLSQALRTCRTVSKHVS